MRVFRNVIDTERARAAFKTSEIVTRLWPATLAEQSLAFFDAQRIINRVMWEGANPLRYIEELTRTSLVKGRLDDDFRSGRWAVTTHFSARRRPATPVWGRQRHG